jgi:hypothetical protein
MLSVGYRMKAHYHAQLVVSRIYDPLASRSSLHPVGTELPHSSGLPRKVH